MEDSKETNSSVSTSCAPSIHAVQNAEDEGEPRSPVLPRPVMSGPSTFKERLVSRTCANFPRLYRAVHRVALYIRGPRPQTDLPGERYVHTVTSEDQALISCAALELSPLLNKTYSFRDRSFSLGVEQYILRHSRPTPAWLLAVLVAAYIIALSFLTRAQYYLVPSSAWLGCTSTFWLRNDQCGLNGVSCEPFSNQTMVRPSDSLL